MRDQYLGDNQTLSSVKNRIVVDDAKNSLINLEQIILNHTEKGFIPEENTIYIKLTDFNSYAEITDESNYSTLGNTLNNGYKDYLDRFVREKFIKALKEEHFEEGYYSDAYKIIVDNIVENEMVTKNWLNEIYLNFFQNDHVLSGIINLIREFDYDLIFPQGQTIALACLTHKNNFIKELAIRAYEKWGNTESLHILKSVQTNIQWLDDYVNDVITDIEAECHTT